MTLQLPLLLAQPIRRLKQRPPAPARKSGNGFPWGVVGLVGLIGLMGRKRRD